ncbi:hypothetical protein [Nonomuraea angiospora]|uniref:hypothetical protein n=1 Tax=Nonomuraea angiospora TaxID=46172 RepID=UPI0029BD6E08|nr:hypothetical protein [Nonomuraea angiospora]MDX3111078.1 hypothetical protein [Nonomuraea angiospora]
MSTAALAPLAECVIGLEPVPAMLVHRRSVASSARFVIGARRSLGPACPPGIIARHPAYTRPG